MAIEEQSQNLIPSEPTLKDLCDLLKKDIFLNLNCHHLATIESFNPLLQTATASINYVKTLFLPDPITGVYRPQNLEYPLAVDCPVICLRGGSSSLTFPITQGDQCLIFFNDRDIDNWFQGSRNSPNATPRAHSFSDGIILVGLSSSDKPLASYDQDRAVLKKGTARVGVGKKGPAPGNLKDLVLIGNDTSTLKTLLLSLTGQLTSLTTQLQSLTAQLALLTVGGVTSGSSASAVPINAAAITAIGTNIGTIATEIVSLNTDIGELLE